MPISGRFGLAMLAMLGLAVATPALAGKTVVMIDSNRSAALAALQPGDTLKLEGTFTTVLNLTNRDFGGVQLQAHGAMLLQGINVNNVQNLAISGGTFGSTTTTTREWYTIRFANVSNVSLAGASIVGTGSTKRSAMHVSGASYLTLRDNDVSGFVMGIQVGGTTDSLITNNRFNNLLEDGLRVISSNRVIVSENSCTNFTPHATAHPDCIQMWTASSTALEGRVQSDIYLLNNTAIGAMQAFVSFDPRTYSGERITFAGNYAAVSYPHGVSCYGCRNSLIQDNVLVTLPGARWETIIRTPNEVNVTKINNPRYDLRPLAGTGDYVLPDRIWSFLTPSIAGLVGSSLAPQTYNSRLVTPINDAIGGFGDTGSVPEPATWLLLGIGFALIGRALRDDRGSLPHALA
jgi:hypothetical protein